MITVCFFGTATGEEDNAAALLLAQVTTESGPLNLRSMPQTDAAILDRIPNGSTVTVINQGDVFWEIQYGDFQGYVMCKFLTLVGASEESATSSLEELSVYKDAAANVMIAQVTTEVGPLNMRNQPEAGATILLRIPNRSLVTVISQDDVFWEITYGDTHGYAMHEFLTMTDYTEDILHYQVLYRGNSGDDVLAIKERLLELGYYREGSTMNNNYNATCVARMMMFQRQNGLTENGIATAEAQAKLFSDSAAANAEELPKVMTSSYIVSSSSSSTDPTNGIDENFDWDQWMLENPGVCPCCFGSGCSCCNFTGKI